MWPQKRRATTAGAGLLGCALAAVVVASGPRPTPADIPLLVGLRPPASELVHPEGLMPLYKWMLAPDLVAAHWLGASLGGKELVEPINVVLEDHKAGSAEEATVVVIEAFKQAGFPNRFGHSSGYYAYVDGRLYPQVPAARDHSFSDQPFEVNNDHGRMFGPVELTGRVVFVAAFSRESVAPLAKVKHQFVSFNRARDTLAERLDARSVYSRVGYVALDNALTDDPQHTTGDHDGRAVLLRRR